MSKTKTNDKRTAHDAARARQFFEELSWILSSYSGLDFKSLPRLLRNELDSRNRTQHAVGGYVSPNPNKHFLVGVLPRLFNDTTLFPSNDDIAEFASTVMHVSIPRFHKKSRYELIGHVVCQTETLSDQQLRDLVKALEVLLNKSDSVAEIVKKRKQGSFGWNKVIQELVAEHSM
jgi:hypothetical protein